MASSITAPEPSALLHPLLACLPTAFVASQPPPALISLLSPILRQRVQIHTSTSGGHPGESNWLPLLCWKSGEATELSRMVEDAHFEPHPVSGEIELGDISSPLYRRQDEETLQAMIKLPDLGLQAMYVWCEHDQQGGPAGWRLSELRLLTLDLPHAWSDSIWKATKAYENANRSDLFGSNVPSLVRSNDSGQLSSAADEDDDADYWARYDGSSVRATPAPQAKTQPMHVRTLSEDDYYSRYAGLDQTIDAEETQQPAAGFGSAAGILVRGLRDQFIDCNEESSERVEDEDHLKREFVPASENIIHTRPSSSSSAPSVAQLEQFAEHQQTQAEMAIQQHIGTSVKSLYRLAKPTGIKRAEFQRLVQNELELLEIWDDDDE